MPPAPRRCPSPAYASASGLQATSSESTAAGRRQRHQRQPNNGIWLSASPTTLGSVIQGNASAPMPAAPEDRRTPSRRVCRRCSQRGFIRRHGCRRRATRSQAARAASRSEQRCLGAGNLIGHQRRRQPPFANGNQTSQMVGCGSSRVPTSRSAAPGHRSQPAVRQWRRGRVDRRRHRHRAKGNWIGVNASTAALGNSRLGRGAVRQQPGGGRNRRQAPAIWLGAHRRQHRRHPWQAPTRWFRQRDRPGMPPARPTCPTAVAQTPPAASRRSGIGHPDRRNRAWRGNNVIAGNNGPPRRARQPKARIWATASGHPVAGHRLCCPPASHRTLPRRMTAPDRRCPQPAMDAPVLTSAKVRRPVDPWRRVCRQRSGDSRCSAAYRSNCSSATTTPVAVARQDAAGQVEH